MPSSEVFHKWKTGKLHSGSKTGPPVKSHAQAIAIYLSEKRKEGQHGGKYPHKAFGGGLGVFPDTNVPPLPGGVGSMMPPQGLGAPMGMPQMPQGLQQGSPMAAFQHLQQLGAARMGQMDWRHMGQMPPQGPQAGMQWPPMGLGMRAGGGEVDDGPPSGDPWVSAGNELRHGLLQMDPAATGMLQRGATPTQEIIPPSSPNVAAAIRRVSAWMQERAQREPQPVLARNIQIMQRGGPMAEGMAKHMLNTFQPHPSEALPAPTPLTIDAERRGGRIGMRADGGGTMDLPNPFLDMDYAPRPPSSAPPPSDALKFWQHPSPKVIPIREHADGGNVVPFGPRLIDANWEKFRLNPQYQQNRETNALLHRVLGMDSNVVPMSPSDSDDKARGGGLGYQFGGSPTGMGLTPGWIERQEARNISHTGPIISAVGGRTDNHAINVPSGSYVLPAAHVSAMGQGNTLNGMQILTRMFGQPMKVPHGAGPPRPPRAMGMSSSGGSRGDGHIGRPVPIMAAGGEFVLSPDQVAKVGGGDVNHGHAVLDRWVQNTHKKYAKTIANLPPPAKT